MPEKVSANGDFGYPWNLRAYATRGIIWTQRRVFSKWLNGINDHRPIPPDYRGQAANDWIRSLLETGRPCLAARFGSVEIDAVLRGYDIARSGSGLVKFLRLFTGSGGPFWWDNSIKAGLLRSTGFFPADEPLLARFSQRLLDDVRQLDALASWNARELQIRRTFCPKCRGVELNALDPFLYHHPWTSALAGKKVLVVHPFGETIRAQYARRKELFADPDVLPAFELSTYKPVVSFLGLETPYANWFEALEHMCDDLSKIDFDAALIGCGAYGLPLGAFVKRDLHRQALHLGGITQFLFGIKGARWDNTDYSRFYNDAWVRPAASERPRGAKLVEGGCYW